VNKVLSNDGGRPLVFIPKIATLQVQEIISRQDKEWERMLNAQEANREWSDAKTRLERWAKGGVGKYLKARWVAANRLINGEKRGLKEIDLRKICLDSIPPFDIVFSTCPDILIENNEIPGPEIMEYYDLQESVDYHGCFVFFL